MQEGIEIEQQHNKGNDDTHQEANEQRESTLAMLESLRKKLKHVPPMLSSEEQKNRRTEES